MTMIWADTLEMILGVVAEPSENLKWSHNPIIRAFGEAKKHWFVIKDKTGRKKTQNCARLVFPPVERLSKANPAAAVCQTHRAQHHPRLGARQSQPDQIFCVILTTWQPDNPNLIRSLSSVSSLSSIICVLEETLWMQRSNAKVPTTPRLTLTSRKGKRKVLVKTEVLPDSFCELDTGRGGEKDIFKVF